MDNISLSEDALDTLFREARSFNGWQDRSLSDDSLRNLYDLIKMGPTSMNCCPARFIFLRTSEGKEKLRPTLADGNVDKVMTAPVVSILAVDHAFYDHMPYLFPHRDVSPIFANNAQLSETTAFRNGTLQGAYLMMAARALGIDCGPISGFNNAKVDALFFEGTAMRSNFICCLGYGDHESIFERLPRFPFDEACTLA